MNTNEHEYYFQPSSGLTVMLSFIREYSCSFVAEIPETEQLFSDRTSSCYAL
jgi:hypothetical protein